MLELRRENEPVHGSWREGGVLSKPGMSAKAKVSGSVVAGFPSPAEQYLEPPLDLNELLVKLRSERIITARHLRDAPDATIRALGGSDAPADGDGTARHFLLRGTGLRRGPRHRGVPCSVSIRRGVD